MNSQLTSPVPMEPNLPTMTPPRSTTPSDLFWQLQTTLTKKTMGPIFNDSILPDYWSTEMKRVLTIQIEDLITIKEMLAATIRDVKKLPTNISHTTSRSTSPNNKPDQIDRTIHGSETTHRLLHEVPIIQEAKLWPPQNNWWSQRKNYSICLQYWHYHYSRWQQTTLNPLDLAKRYPPSQCLNQTSQNQIQLSMHESHQNIHQYFQDWMGTTNASRRSNQTTRIWPLITHFSSRCRTILPLCHQWCQGPQLSPDPSE